MHLLHTMNFSLQKISDALDIPNNSIIELFTDGRPASFLIKQKMAHDFHWRMGDKNDDYDWRDDDNKYVENRVLTSNGVSFVPNKMLGVGRSFDEGGFLDKLDFISYFTVSDVIKFPTVKIYKVDSSTIRNWYMSGRILEGGKMTASTFYHLLDQLDLF